MQIRSLGFSPYVREPPILEVPDDKYETGQETPPIFMPEWPDDIPGKTFEEEVDERGERDEPIKLGQSQSPPIVPEEMPPEGGSGLPWALIGAAAFFLL